MAEVDPKTPEKKQKRRLKAAPTLREQAETSAAKNNSNKTSRTRRFFGSKLFAPFRLVGRGVKKIWMSKPLKPIRFITKILGAILVPKYFRNSWKELRYVSWPDFRTTWRLTFAVIVFGVIFGLSIAGLDIVLEKLFREVLLG